MSRLIALIGLSPWVLLFVGGFIEALIYEEHRHMALPAFAVALPVLYAFLILLYDVIKWLRSKKPIQTATTFWREFKEFREWRKHKRAF